MLDKRSDSIAIKIEELQDESYHVFVKVKVNKRVCRFLLDTGASKTVIDESFLHEKLKNQHVNKLDSSTSSLHDTVHESQVTRLKEISLESITLKDYLVAVIDLSHVNVTYSQVKRKSIQGILGSDILFDLRAVIDYGKSSMKVIRPSQPMKAKPVSKTRKRNS